MIDQLVERVVGQLNRVDFLENLGFHRVQLRLDSEEFQEKTIPSFRGFLRIGLGVLFGFGRILSSIFFDFHFLHFVFNHFRIVIVIIIVVFILLFDHR